MRNREPREESGRVLAVAAAVWGTVIGMAALEGAFALFESSTLGVLAALASLYAVAAYFLDRPLRAYTTQVDRWRAAGLASALDLALAAALVLGSVPLAVFCAPLAAFASVAATGSWMRRGSPWRRTLAQCLRSHLT